jgi:hypothetical protein
MQAVKCPVCRLDCDPGDDYGALKIATTPWHFNRSAGEYTALLAEGPNDRYYEDVPCLGSQRLGEVVNFDK